MFTPIHLDSDNSYIPELIHNNFDKDLDFSCLFENKHKIRLDIQKIDSKLEIIQQIVGIEMTMEVYSFIKDFQRPILNKIAVDVGLFDDKSDLKTKMDKFVKIKLICKKLALINESFAEYKILRATLNRFNNNFQLVKDLFPASGNIKIILVDFSMFLIKKYSLESELYSKYEKFEGVDLIQFLERLQDQESTLFKYSGGSKTLDNVSERNLSVIGNGMDDDKLSYNSYTYNKTLVSQSQRGRPRKNKDAPHLHSLRQSQLDFTKVKDKDSTLQMEGFSQVSLISLNNELNKLNQKDDQQLQEQSQALQFQNQQKEDKMNLNNTANNSSGNQLQAVQQQIIPAKQIDIICISDSEDEISPPSKQTELQEGNSPFSQFKPIINQGPNKNSSVFLPLNKQNLEFIQGFPGVLPYSNLNQQSLRNQADINQRFIQANSQQIPSNLIQIHNNNLLRVPPSQQQLFANNIDQLLDSYAFQQQKQTQAQQKFFPLPQPKLQPSVAQNLLIPPQQAQQIQNIQPNIMIQQKSLQTQQTEVNKLIGPDKVCYRCSSPLTKNYKTLVNPFTVFPSKINECVSCQLLAVDIFAPSFQRFGDLLQVEIPKLDQQSKSYLLNFNYYKASLKPNEEIELRCLKINSKFEYETEFPPGFSFKVNNAKKNEVKARDPNVAGRRKDLPYMIGQDLTKTGMVQKIAITVTPYPKENDSIYIFGVYQVLNLSNASPEEVLSQQIVISKQVGSHIAKRNFEENFIEMEKFSVKCQYLFANVIQFPGRGKLCTHFQCFDLKTYISMNQKNQIWKCPVCNKRAIEIYFDQFFFEIISNLTEKEKDESDLKIDQTLKVISKHRIMIWNSESCSFGQEQEKKTISKITIIQQNPEISENNLQENSEIKQELNLKQAKQDLAENLDSDSSLEILEVVPARDYKKAPNIPIPNAQNIEQVDQQKQQLFIQQSKNSTQNQQDLSKNILPQKRPMEQSSNLFATDKRQKSAFEKVIPKNASIITSKQNQPKNQNDAQNMFQSPVPRKDVIEIPESNYINLVSTESKNDDNTSQELNQNMDLLERCRRRQLKFSSPGSSLRNFQQPQDLSETLKQILGHKN
ncbi:zf-miz domain containing protein [Stylonychia lemnae]|uniref:Zf-miz domain containing protein n=1 Tax=Stylonychia lemnae TaxID=5949 RepID=A0A078A194_STYLE|nr:zf-miz domain containing protein [Stylonychia lemnae]|eukprot:CDW75622.1 zf-miz domain containing protein [Stylonychia lemnae]